MEDESLEEILHLLEKLQQNQSIKNLEVGTKAQITPQEKLVCTLTFEVTSGLTIDKYHKIASFFQEHFPYFSIKRVYHKHQIVLYYSYED